MSQTNSSTSSFKLFLVKVLLPFLLSLIVAGYLFGLFFEKKVILNSAICGAYKVDRIINETHPDEIPIFGSSRADGGYIPDMLGANYFNYGLNGTGPNVMLFFLKEECKKRKNHPVIILNFDLAGFVHPLGDISNYIYNSGYLPVRELLGKNYKTMYSIPFIKYYGQYESYLKYYLNNKMNITMYTNKGASVEKNKMTKERFNELVNERKLTHETFRHDTAMENEYMQIISENPQRLFVFVIAPYHSSYFAKFENLPDAENFIDTLKKKKNVKVFDFSKENYPDSLFINTMHLNYTGAVRFNKDLKDSLAKLSY
jgi:hypothetical protein